MGYNGSGYSNTVEAEAIMEKYRYWSKTNNKFIRIFAVIGDYQVVLFYEDLEKFKEMGKFDWTKALQKGDIVEGWEDEE